MLLSEVVEERKSTISSDQREKFRAWSNAYEKLSKEEKDQECEKWLEAAILILNGE